MCTLEIDILLRSWFVLITFSHGYQEITTTRTASQHSYQTNAGPHEIQQAVSLTPASHGQHLPHQAASTATKELDDLMASLSEFKVGLFMPGLLNLLRLFWFSSFTVLKICFLLKAVYIYYNLIHITDLTYIPDNCTFWKLSCKTWVSNQLELR